MRAFCLALAVLVGCNGAAPEADNIKNDVPKLSKDQRVKITTQELDAAMERGEAARPLVLMFGDAYAAGDNGRWRALHLIQNEFNRRYDADAQGGAAWLRAELAGKSLMDIPPVTKEEFLRAGGSPEKERYAPFPE